MLHALQPKTTWLQVQLTRLPLVVVLPVAQRMAMANQNQPPVAPVITNQNLQHAALVKAIQSHLRVVQVKVTANLKHQPVAPPAEAEESKKLFVPGPVLTDRELFLLIVILWNTLLFSGILPIVATSAASIAISFQKTIIPA